MAIDAGTDLVQHPDISGKHPHPDGLLHELIIRQVACAALVQTERHLATNRQRTDDQDLEAWNAVKDVNNRKFIKRDARMLLTTDAFVIRPDMRDELLSCPNVNNDALPVSMNSISVLDLHRCSRLRSLPTSTR